MKRSGRRPYVLSQPLHDLALRHNLLPVPSVRRVAHHNPKRNVLTAMKRNVCDARAFPRATLAKKRHGGVRRQVFRASFPPVNGPRNGGNCFAVRLDAAVGPGTWLLRNHGVGLLLEFWGPLHSLLQSSEFMKQGSPEWLAERAKHAATCSSYATALGIGYVTRQAYMRERV